MANRSCMTCGSSVRISPRTGTRSRNRKPGYSVSRCSFSYGSSYRIFFSPYRWRSPGTARIIAPPGFETRRSSSGTIGANTSVSKIGGSVRHRDAEHAADGERNLAVFFRRRLHGEFGNVEPVESGFRAVCREKLGKPARCSILRRSPRQERRIFRPEDIGAQARSARR